jgi:hypothetical protein
MERLGNAAARAAESETHRQVDHAVRNAIRCAVGDRICQQKAKQEGKEVILVDGNGNPVGSGALGAASWRLELGAEEWEGHAGHVIEDEVLFTLHLAADDDVTLYLFLTDDDEGERDAAAVVLATDDEDTCRYPYEGSAPFVVRLDRVDSNTVAGAYEGRVRCEDAASPVRARGTFRIAR